MYNAVTTWILIGVLTLGAIATVMRIGKPRKPITAGDAAFSVALNILLIAALLIWGHIR